MYVGGGSFGSYHDLIDDIVEQIDCSNPPLYNNEGDESFEEVSTLLYSFAVPRESAF
jgi:hypothetical protein